MQIAAATHLDVLKVLCTICHQVSVDHYPKASKQLLRTHDGRVKKYPKTPLRALRPLWVFQVVVRIFGELLEQMITDASFASIAEHAALKAVMRP